MKTNSALAKILSLMLVASALTSALLAMRKLRSWPPGQCVNQSTLR